METVFKTLIVSLFLVVGVSVTTAFGAGESHERGNWPTSWPQELEPLRSQSQTMTGGIAMLSRHEIRFGDRAQFEAAWPHILKVKSEGAPIVLYRGPSSKYRCQVRVQCPSLYEKPQSPAKPIMSATDTRTRWIKTQYLELYVDGETVDLNRIRIPKDTPIVDMRFKDSISMP